MDQFDIMLWMCRSECKEEEAVSVEEVAKFQRVTMGRGVSCSYRDSYLQYVVGCCCCIPQILCYFTNWG